MFDLISIGDTAVDHFFQISAARVEKGKDGQELCLKFGDKLPVERYQQILGGNNTNNAVGAVRLGLKAALYANVGTDLAGKFTLATLKEEGVDTRYVVVNEGVQSNVSALISYQGERTILTYHQDYKYQLPDLDKSRWLYLSSMAKSAITSNLISQVENYLERCGSSLVFNPGTFEIAFGIKKFPKLLSLTTILIINKEEAGLILGENDQVFHSGIGVRSKRGELVIKKILTKLSDLGPKMVIITDGKEGSYGFDGRKFYKLGIFPTEVADMTGAGDAYATGVVAGFFYGQDLGEAMRWGAANGAAVVEQIGPQAGLLTYAQIQEKLKENAKIIISELR